MNDDKSLFESKKATAFVIAVSCIMALFIFGMIFHADVVAIIDKLYQLALGYLGIQGGSDIAHKICVAPKQVDAQPDEPTPQYEDKYANR